MTSIPVFMIWRELHAIGTFVPLVLPSLLGGAFNVFLLRQFLLDVPRELDEAAMVDGAGPVRIWWNVLVPCMTPALATVGVFTFLGQWDNFEGPLIYLNSPDKYTVSIGLRMFQDTFGGDVGPHRADDRHLLRSEVVHQGNRHQRARGTLRGQVPSHFEARSE